MNKPWHSVLALALVSTVVGCQTASAPRRIDAASAPRLTLAVPALAEATAAPAPGSTDLPVSVSAPAPAFAPSLFASSAVACDAQHESRAFYGFYRTDAHREGDVVLTFDDGPHPTYTPRVLDLLAEHTMTATFFVVGRGISRSTYPLIQRMVAEGHTIGSHSYSHDVKMTRVATPAFSVEEIRGQHETTAVLIDLAVMATSGDDFDAMYRRVTGADPAVWLAASTIHKQWRGYLARHRDLLIERGYRDGARPYAVLYSRPPGGGPYVDHDGAAGVAIYNDALRSLGMMNVLWNGASGDVDPDHRGELAYLTGNLDRYSRSGGVILIHDHIRADALAHALSTMAADERVKIIPIQEATQRKYGCSSDALGAMLAVDAVDAVDAILGRGAVVATRPALGAAPAGGVVASRRRSPDDSDAR